MTDPVTGHRRVYVDHNATSPLRPEVLAIMRAALASVYANPSSVHEAGTDARRAVSVARRHVAALADAAPSDVIFTSGGTEANNLAITGAVRARQRAASGGRPLAVLVGATEHHAVLRPAEALAEPGIVLRTIDVDRLGVITPDALADALGDGDVTPAIVSIGLANNETGVLQDVPTLARLARARGAIFHTDAVQAAGRVPLDVRAAGIDLCSLSAHKLGGPKGVGALVMRPGVELSPILHGGGQERGLRSGTLPAPSIAGMGEACRTARASLDTHAARLEELSYRLEMAVRERFPSAIVHGGGAERLPGTSSLGLPGADGEALLIALDLMGVCVSAGAACTTGAVEPSHVLQAMGVDPDVSRGTIRVSFGWSNEPGDVDRVVEALSRALTGIPAT